MKLDRIVGKPDDKVAWGSDIAAQMLRRFNIPFISLNPGASYRGFHDSLRADEFPALLGMNHFEPGQTRDRRIGFGIEEIATLDTGIEEFSRVRHQLGESERTNRTDCLVEEIAFYIHETVGNGRVDSLGDRVEVRLMEAAPVSGGLRFEMLSDGRKGKPTSRRSMRGRITTRGRRR